MPITENVPHTPHRYTSTARTWLSAVAALALACIAGAPLAAAAPSQVSPDNIWQPAPGTSWQWQLDGVLDLSVAARVYDIDLFTTEPNTIVKLHEAGRKVICYINVGAWEDWRPDKGRFPTALIGNDYSGWPGEKWLDIRAVDQLAPALEARLDMCRAKGFDGVEPDNVDGFAQDTGFPLTSDDQLRFNRWLAGAAHARGLAIGLKNDAPQVLDLVGQFDFAVVEECFESGECDRYRPFVAAGKAVFEAEYKLRPDQFCPQANSLNFDALRKERGLTAERVACRVDAAPAPPPANTPAPGALSTPAPTAPIATGASTRPAVERVFGVTIDNLDDVPAIVASLRDLAHRPTTRIVFDRDQPASSVREQVAQIHQVSAVMAPILDSHDVAAISAQAYVARTRDYLAVLGNVVDIWEIGNEINGEWLGETSSVVDKMTGAFDLVQAAGRPTALTLYYNQGCVEDQGHEMFTWAQANVPERMRRGLDYALISYYEDDCNGLRPDWSQVFPRLAQLFPHAKIGFGEAGTLDASKKAEYMRRYYGLHVDHPAFIGGVFWWYYRQDCVPASQPLWSVLNASLNL
jgi:hypothetical protein